MPAAEDKTVERDGYCEGCGARVDGHVDECMCVNKYGEEEEG